MVDFIFHSVCNGTCNAIGRSYNPFLPVIWINLIHETVRPGFLNTGLSNRNAGVAQWLERHVANVIVVGSNPITRSLPQKEQNCFGAFTRRRLLGAGIFLLWRIFYPEAILDPSPGGCLNPRCSQ